MYSQWCCREYLKNKDINMTKTVLITGGAGFIGQRLALALLARNSKVRILDTFNPQIHTIDSLPANLNCKVELIKADVRDSDALRNALQGIDCVVHLAAETGTGQSMYEIDRYFSVNVQGTARLLDLLQNDKVGKSVKSIIVASSRATIGEGAYQCAEHGTVYPEPRERGSMRAGEFEPECPICRKSVLLKATTEDAPFKPMSMYGLTKQVQEQAVLMYARTAGINGFALRYQNVYGPGQSLKNPYTGILAVFSNLARQNQNIDVYEDGLESRDFVYIDDVVEATVRAVYHNAPFVGVLNVGSGIQTTVMQVAQAVKAFFKSDSKISVTGAFRMGDIRHNIADTTALEAVLDFKPRMKFTEGLNNFLTWAASEPAQDKAAYEKSVKELASRGLMNF
jgi:dTDP-L-rhamnose 4-epimerase